MKKRNFCLFFRPALKKNTLLDICHIFLLFFQTYPILEGKNKTFLDICHVFQTCSVLDKRKKFYCYHYLLFIL